MARSASYLERGVQPLDSLERGKVSSVFYDVCSLTGSYWKNGWRRSLSSETWTDELCNLYSPTFLDTLEVDSCHKECHRFSAVLRYSLEDGTFLLT